LLGCAARPETPATTTTTMAKATATTAVTTRPPFLLGGIQVNEDNHAHWVKTLRESGLNTVEVTVYAKQGDWDSANLWYEDAPSVIDEMRAAKAGGLHVVLILRVALDHAFPRNKYLWHGMIMPNSDADVREWFRRYRTFVSQWSAIAAREGVDVVAIASEMNSLTSTAAIDELPALYQWWLDDKAQARQQARALALGAGVEQEELQNDQRAHRAWATAISHGGDLIAVNARRALLEREWLALIEEARRQFPGPLTYAANFDQYTEVRLWPKLDLMGINAYFKLRTTTKLPDDEAALARVLDKGWAEVWRDIRAFADKNGPGGKAVLFTELGYTRRRGSTLEPWSSQGFSVVGSERDPALIIWNAQDEDLRERALAVRALDKAVDGSPLFRGALYWKLSTIPAHKDIEPFVLILNDSTAKQPDPLLPALLDLRP
jgi:hypothetical protein